MTIFEAALSALPIITTDASPITDFLTERTAYLVPATLEDCTLWPCSTKGMFIDYNGGSTVGPPQWWLPDVDKLAATMQEVYKNQKEAKKRGNAAREEMLVRAHVHTWDDGSKPLSGRVPETNPLPTLLLMKIMFGIG